LKFLNCFKIENENITLFLHENQLHFNGKGTHGLDDFVFVQVKELNDVNWNMIFQNIEGIDFKK
jgi:hypothetical protein